MELISHQSHFADPHKLLKTEYDSTAEDTCDICRSKLAGLPGYRCNICNFDIHVECADHFTETVSCFFAHPWHELKLSHIPNDPHIRLVCDLCREECPAGSFVYRCMHCAFDVHPLCKMLPQAIRNPLHPEHDLCMTPASGHHWHCMPSSGQSSNSQVGADQPQEQQSTAAAASQTTNGTRTSERVAKFLAKTVVTATAGGLASKVFDMLAEAMD